MGGVVMLVVVAGQARRAPAGMAPAPARHDGIQRRERVRKTAVLEAPCSPFSGSVSALDTHGVSTAALSGRKPVYQLHLVLRRNAAYYTNIMTLMGLMSSVALATFVLAPASFSERANVVLVLLLNAVAYKYAVASELPHVSYSTTFDTYMNASIIFLLVIFMENALVSWPTRYFGSATLKDGLRDSPRWGHPFAQARSEEHGGSTAWFTAQQVAVDHVLSVGIAVGWVVYNARFLWRVRRYAANLDALMGPQINIGAEQAMYAVEATRLEM
jgi:hypothetical protein